MFTSRPTPQSVLSGRSSCATARLTENRHAEAPCVRRGRASHDPPSNGHSATTACVRGRPRRRDSQSPVDTAPLRKPSTGISVSHGPTNALSATIARPCGYVRRTPPLDATGCDAFRHAMETYRERSPTISFVLRKRGTPVRSDGSHVTTAPALIRAFAATSGFAGIHF